METRAMETFREIRRICVFCHEVAHWKLFGVMETFGIPGESFQCAHEVGGFHDTGGGRYHRGWLKIDVFDGASDCEFAIGCVFKEGNGNAFTPPQKNAPLGSFSCTE